MKKIVLLFTLLISSIMIGQNESKNEIKLNAFSIIALSSIDITYERILSNESAIGTSLFIYTGGNDEDFAEVYKSFSLTPYYRNYFSSGYAKGFFVEAFSMISSRNNSFYDYDYYNDNREEKKKINFALGIAVGGKWVTKKGFIAEISIGIGRNLFQNNNDEYYDEAPVVGRGGISIGKRF
jgi:hypothetical protein